DNIVRKTSRDSPYNKRLKSQYVKQLESSLSHPQLLGCGYENDLFYFDSEFVLGTKGEAFIQNSSINDCIRLIDSIINDITLPTDSVIEQSEFLGKLDTLPYKEILTKYDWSGFKSSETHGDLTLENIIIQDTNRIY